MPAAVFSGQAKSIYVGGNPKTAHVKKGTKVKLQRASPEPRWPKFTLSFAFSLDGSNSNTDPIDDGNKRATERMLLSPRSFAPRNPEFKQSCCMEKKDTRCVGDRDPIISPPPLFAPPKVAEANCGGKNVHRSHPLAVPNS
jgi:hypothetical protein